ncbi:MAG: hypothetical protein ACYDA8_08455, partial [Deferrisomatales bacterium]
MEYALRLEQPGPLPADPRDACPAPWAGQLPPGRLAAVYFGSEFCAERLPSAAEAGAWCRWAGAEGLEPVLLTPVVTDPGLARLGGLLAALAADGHRPTVSFNDWGVLELLRRHFPDHPRRAGRCLNRALRDPRAAGQGALPGPSPRRAPRLRTLLAAAGAVGIETDPDLEGGYLGDGQDGLQRALHLPFAFAASGRHCLVKAEAGPAGL